MINIAIISPAENAVSETFIKAHRELINGNIHYLYGGLLPTHFSKNGHSLKHSVPLSKWQKLLPFFLHERMMKRKQNREKILETYLSENNIQLVLAEYGLTGCAVHAVCKKLSIPVIVHFHGFDAFKTSIIEVYKEKYKQLFQYASFIIAVSVKMNDKLLQLGAPPDKLIYSVYGSHPDFFEINPDLKNGYFLAVGRFVEKKAPYITLLAFKKLQDVHADAKLVMAGDGPLLPVCKQLAKSLYLRNVEFKGAVPHNEVMDLFSKAMCFVQHSITTEDGDAEGTPVAVLEAGAARLPVIATIHSGIPDVIVHDETGFLIAEGDIDAMANYMILIYENESKRTAMGLIARKHIAVNFTQQKHISTLNGLIERSVK